MALLPLTPKIQSHIDRYAESHRNPMNQMCHFAGIPMLMVSSLGLLRKGLGEPLPTWLVASGAGAWYAHWDGRTAPWLAAAVGGCYEAGKRFTGPQLLAMFGIGAALHIVGHYEFEHKPPAFLSRPISVLEAPAWLLSLALGRRPKPSPPHGAARKEESVVRRGGHFTLLTGVGLEGNSAEARMP